MAASTKYRRETIVERACESGHVSVSQLAENLCVSEATIRRDLHALAEDGRLELTHGGAYITKTADYSFRSKSTRNIEGKRIIGKLAAELINDGDQLFLDSGTTCFELAGFLRRKRGLSIIVNSVYIAEKLDAPGMRVIMLGGQYRPERMDCTGPLATSALDQLRGYVAFIGSDGLDSQFGLTASDIESADLFGKAIANARHVILVADHTKFESPSLFKIAGWEKITKAVTDARPTPQWEEFFSSKDIELIYPATENAQIRRNT